MEPSTVKDTEDISGTLARTPHPAPLDEAVRLDGRVALVTGAGRGIGRAIALALARQGAEVVLAARTEVELQAVAAEIASGGERATFVACDVTDAEQVAALLEFVADQQRGLHILVNAAGGAHRLREVSEVDESTFALGIQLNLTSVQRTMRAAAPLLFAHPGQASVLNIVSIAATRGLQRLSYYSAAKAGVVALTRTAAREWGERGVRANCLGPGWIETSLSQPLRDDHEFFASSVSQIPLGRWGEPAEIANVAAFMVSDAARYVTGQTLYVDGGLLA